ncbi:MAG: transposase, partial [Magnetococcus sp. DMHC-6]
MDSAYDAKEIKDYILAHGHVPLIDINTRNNVKRREELNEEKKAFKTIRMEIPEELRYNERSTAERVNGQLKDEFGGKMVRVRGNAKIMCHLMFGILILTADQLMKVVT